MNKLNKMKKSYLQVASIVLLLLLAVSTRFPCVGCRCGKGNVMKKELKVTAKVLTSKKYW